MYRSSNRNERGQLRGEAVAETAGDPRNRSSGNAADHHPEESAPPLSATGLFGSSDYVVESSVRFSSKCNYLSTTKIISKSGSYGV